MHIILNLILHTKEELNWLASQYGTEIFIFIFAIIFCETGLVVTPFLPGDSLLFTAGMLCAEGKLNINILIIVAACAAILGDALNYLIGKKVGQKIYDSNFLSMRKNIDKTHAFFERNGGKTIIIARFMPVIRTFAPFVAGTGQMKYLRFLSFNAIGGAGWVLVASLAGYLFAHNQFVTAHFTTVLYGIVVLSIAPMIIVKFIEIMKNRKRKTQDSAK